MIKYSILALTFLCFACDNNNESETDTSEEKVTQDKPTMAEAKTFEGEAAVLKGVIKDGAGKRVLLQRMPIGQPTYQTIDETVINEDGSFALQSDVDFTDFYMIKVLPSSAPQHLAYANLILSKGEDVSFTAEADDILNTYAVSGSKESENLFKYFNDYVRPFQYSIDSMKAFYPNVEKDQNVQKEFNKALEPLRKKNLKTLDKIVSTNRNSPVGYFAQLNLINELRNTGGEVSPAELDELDEFVRVIQQTMPQSITPSQALSNATQLRNMLVSEVGGPAPEIAYPDTEGNIRKLSDLKGKVVMIDFWASWCGPCRKQNPHVVSLYNKYKDKGFEIFSVSLDRAKEPWLQAIKADGLAWPNHVSELKFWQSSVVQTYGVKSIPRVVLVDREGNIIKSNVSPQELDAQLQRIFGA